MKKLTAILLLTIFVFNTIGYRLWLEYVQSKSDTALEARLDKGLYSDDELVTVKIPINMPYQSNWASFERTDGEVSVNGTVYKYVKKKVYNDTMILMCIPHEEKTALQQKANDFFGKTNDIPLNGKRSADAFKQLFNDYYVSKTVSVSYSFNSYPDYNLFRNKIAPQQYTPFRGQPPKALA